MLWVQSNQIIISLFQFIRPSIVKAYKYVTDSVQIKYSLGFNLFVLFFISNFLILTFYLICLKLQNLKNI